MNVTRDLQLGFIKQSWPGCATGRAKVWTS